MTGNETGSGHETKLAWVVGVGALHGTGAAVAQRFANEGLTAVVTGRSPQRLAEVVRAIEATGGAALAAPGDVTSERDLIDILAHIDNIGALEVGVYNAGSARWAPTLELDSASFEDAWRVCCLGGFIFGREVARSMLARGRGTILFTGATASLRGRPQFAAFAAAKAGLRMVSQSLAREFQPQGLHVAHVVIDGSIHGEKVLTRVPDLADRKGPDGMLQIEAIADAYWYLHQQHRSAWTHELDLRPFAESF
ncbi:SDR family NAD(P)-dependent oxidoreductase [Paraburkholderia rhizosphaerae]|uniref:NADP-dependent 3-hydroxy acid dehydrogenase YdfG n=1 Tax=Paraburkholderia rhizosphaerae TaxID=480658 RepID=A0A4R8LQL0_9BURK|nr:SDR family NAD(P)-dependent oxidoreductase [Paraburkholderia rhizosphaerae]TDY47634.1 NADP-dependent 3-hydroxy acid dehydrogenase YdfG [Paraburkholderia rhizosphaerae]